MPDGAHPTEEERGSGLHVVPRGDLIAHTTRAECTCGPDLEINDNGDLWIHHSLDGREKSE